jgi:hypothetical protein
MLSLFKKRDENQNGIENWNIDTSPGFKMIKNKDSIQYLNEDESRMIYFSVLKVDGDPLSTADALPEEPKIIEEDNGWQLKGIKKAPGQILVCVISFKRQGDTEWAKEFFSSVTYKNA